MNIGDRVESAIRKKVEEGKLTESTVFIAKGSAKVTYGFARGTMAVAGLLGHGITGILMRRPVSAGYAGKIIREGFGVASKNIGDGIQTIEKGLRQRRNK